VKRQALVSFLCGLVFAVGLGVSGMTQPSKVIGFLDVAGAWDASLALVMAGAVGVHMALYRLILRRRSPLLAERFALLTRNDIDGPLVVGAAIFGVGWGLAGYCPGPALASLGSGATSALVFVAAMLAGMALFRGVDALRPARKENAPAGGVRT
jgi:uncharacterized membrane protein YedE/YeeE